MKLERGKFYQTRDRQIVGPMFPLEGGESYFSEDDHGIVWASSGSVNGDGTPDDWDLVCECPAPDAEPHDPVNHPAHYASGSVECIDAIEAQLTPEEFRGYLKGNIVKYVWRERTKGGVESLRKAEWYLKKLIGKSE